MKTRASRCVGLAPPTFRIIAVFEPLDEGEREPQSLSDALSLAAHTQKPNAYAAKAQGGETSFEA